MLFICYPKCSTCKKASEGMLVKRPLLVADDFVLVGFKEKDWEERVL